MKKYTIEFYRDYGLRMAAVPITAKDDDNAKTKVKGSLPSRFKRDDVWSVQILNARGKITGLWTYKVAPSEQQRKEITKD